MPQAAYPGRPRPRPRLRPRRRRRGINPNSRPRLVLGRTALVLVLGLAGLRLVDVQAFYESDTGKRVVAVENGEVPAATAGSDNGTAALDTIAEATGAGKAVSMLAERGLNEAFDLALKHRCFGLDKVPMAGLLAGFVKKAQLTTLKESVNTAVRRRYAALSPADRDAYLAFVTSGAGRKFLTVRGNVIADAAGRAGDALSAPMAAHVDALCAASKQASAK